MSPCPGSSPSAAEAFLADPRHHGGRAVERMDTHISTLFLAGDRVFKLKKPVLLPFLDFTTLAARQAACEAEVEINRRASPDLYVGVRALTRAPAGGLELDGEGEAVEWAVEMRRFDQETLFDRLARRGELDRGRCDALTEAVAAFHRVAPVRADRGGQAGLDWTVATNRLSMLARDPSVLPVDEVEELARASFAALERFAPRLEERRAAGFVRQCHGDLHLGNICLWQGRPALFDAIEFSEDIACIDVIYDLAFLLMDLDHRGARQQANWVMNHYLDLTADFAGLAPMPLYLSARAGVRAHVSAAMAAGAQGAARERLAADARSYLAAARAYLDPPPPRLLAVGGLSGSGKSRMGRELAPFLAVPGAAVVRSDSLRKHLMGVPVHDRLGPDGYGPEVTERTYRRLYDTCAALLADGQAVVADAVFARPEQRDAIERVARAAGVPFDGLWLEAPAELSKRRIAGRKANVSDATPQVLDHQLSYDLGAIAWTRIDSSPPKDVTLAAGRAALGV
nr:bifunctional aminoglycoside phosphotransferase/ATP-binding protein [Paramagnetospirillum caucaseum]